MSLINQMLKDLESRRNPALPAGKILPGNSGSATQQKRSFLIPVLLLAVILLAIGLSYTLWNSSAETSHVAKNNQANTPTAPLASAMDSTAPSVTPAIEQTPPTIVRPAAAPQPPLVSKSPPPSTAAAAQIPAHLYSITPSVVDGSWQSRSLTLKGESFSHDHRIVVSWAGQEKMLPGDQVEWINATTARIKLVTGNNDEVWQVALQRPDGSRSRSVEFEVVASPYIRGTQVTESRQPQIEKTIRPPSKEEQADQLYQQGYRALQQRLADKAEQLWQQALTTAPEHVKSREGLVALYLSQGRKVEASGLLEKGVEQHPENATLALLYARLLTEQGDIATALTTLEQAIGNAPQRPDLYALAAALYQQQQHYPQSIRSYQRALQLQPQQSNWWMGLGISLEGDGKLAEAKSAYEEALRRGMLNGESRAYVEQRLAALR